MIDNAVCPPGTAFAALVDDIRGHRKNTEQAVGALVAQLTDDEMLWLLDGDVKLAKGLWEAIKRYNAVPYEAGRIDRLGIPGIRFTDGPRGIVMGAATAFPAAIARAATWDTDLERRIGDAIGAEARVLGANLFAGICVNLAYAPGWGRSQESYGEDPILLGAMGSALTEGVNPWVLSCVKHFALNSMEEARFSVDVTVEENIMREIYLPHFRAVVEAGADSVMTAYNSVNGEWAGQNRHLLTDILRRDWGFRGFVMTDFVWGLRNPVESVSAGQDLEMPGRQQRAGTLPAALSDGRLSRTDVIASATRLLTAQIELALRARDLPSADVVAGPDHRALAREAARRGTVLLRNETVGDTMMLPLVAASLQRVAVVGPLADDANLGDVGSSQVRPPTTSSVLQGLRERLGDRVVSVEHTDEDLIARAARAADIAVVVVGLDSRDEGEAMVAGDTDAMRTLGGIARFRPAAWAIGKVITAVGRVKKMGGDRRDLRVHESDVRLIDIVSAANPRTVVVVVGGGTVVVDPWDTAVASILLAWYPGMEGGRGIADVLFGDAEPTGRLPIAIPRWRQDLPTIDWAAHRVTYGRWWGQRKLDLDKTTAAYPFGFGLGYTTFEIADLRIEPVKEEQFAASVAVTNTGSRTGRHVVQIYAHLPGHNHPVRALVGFSAVGPIEGGETVSVNVTCSIRPLQHWTDGRFVTPTGAITLEAGAYSGDPDCVLATTIL